MRGECVALYLKECPMTIKKVSTRSAWKKNLYENRGYPDNYTDASFLEELKKNVHSRGVSYGEAIRGGGLVARQLCIVVWFALIFVYVNNEWIAPETVFVYSSLLTGIGYLLFRAVHTSVNYSTVFWGDLHTVLIFVSFGYVLSPILKTLTETISTDTIYAMTTIMSCVHLIFFDYGVPAAVVSSALSLNAAIFGSICLASRLSSSFHAFVLLTVAVELYALFPMLLSTVRGSLLTVGSMIIVTVYFLFTVSSILTFLFICSVTFITVVCPLCFVKWQCHKDNIYGPWDEAVVSEIDM